VIYIKLNSKNYHRVLVSLMHKLAKHTLNKYVVDSRQITCTFIYPYINIAEATKITFVREFQKSSVRTISQSGYANCTLNNLKL